MWGWVLSLVIVLGITLDLIWVLVWVLVWGSICVLFIARLSQLAILYDYSCIYLLYFSFLYLFLSSLYILLIKYLPPFFIININNVLSLKCLFYFKYHIYFIWDSSTILRIPDEAPYYVRQYRGRSHLCPDIYYNMLYLLFVSVFCAFTYVSFVCHPGDLYILCIVYILFSSLFILLYHICVA